MKILMVTKNWVGDILFEFPAIEAIKKAYPDSTIACLAPARCREILVNHPAIDEVIIFDERNEHKTLWSRIRFVLRLRKGKWDQAYIFHRSRTRAFILWLGGVRERIGFGGKRKLFLTRAVDEPDPLHHQVDHFLMMLDGVGVPREENAKYRFYFREDQDARIAKMLEDHAISHFACFHLGANWEPKRWSPKSFAELAEKLYEKHEIAIVVTGAKRDQVLFDEMKKHLINAKVFCFVGRTDLGELGALFKRSAFIVSGDSGPLHVASGVGARVVEIFGPTDPKQTGARGVGEIELVQYIPEGYEPPWYGDLPRDGWLENIPSDEVFQAIEKRGWAIRRDKVEK